MIGVEFLGHNSFSGLLDGFSVEEYDWYIYESEIIINQTQCDFNGFIDVSELKKILYDPKALIIFLNLQAFPKKIKAEKILNYNDFLLSSCAFVIFITDVSFVEIYAKSEEEILKFAKNAKSVSAENLTIKTQENDSRTYFCVV